MAHEVENQEEEISIKRLARQQIENQQKTNEMYKQLDKLLSSIPDPIVRDFAFDLSWDLKEKLKKSQGFNFEKNLNHQTQAVNSIVAVFENLDIKDTVIHKGIKQEIHSKR